MKQIYILILLLFTAVIYSYAKDVPYQARIDSIKIKGTVDYLKDGDQVDLIVYKYNRYFTYPEFNKTYTVISVKNSFSFVIPALNELEYVDISLPKYGKRYLKYLVRRNDNIRLSEVSGILDFKGAGSRKHVVQCRLKALRDYYENTTHIRDSNFELKLQYRLRIIDLWKLKGLDYLRSIRKNLPTDDYQVLKNEWIIEAELSKEFYYHYNLDSINHGYLPVINNYNFISRNWESAINAINKIKNSPTLSFFLIEKFKVDSCELLGKEMDIRKCYQYILNNYSGKLREQLLTEMLYLYRNEGSGEFSTLIRNALPFIKNADFKNVFKKLMDSRMEGTRALDFSLKNENGEVKKLSDFKGKVVLIDFWFTGCGACRTIHPILDSVRNLYSRDSFVLISISVDRKSDTWKESIRGGYYTSVENINLLAGDSATSPNVYYEINVFPTLLLIDNKGRMCNPPSDPMADNGRLLVKEINALITGK